MFFLIRCYFDLRNYGFMNFHRTILRSDECYSRNTGTISYRCDHNSKDNHMGKRRSPEWCSILVWMESMNKRLEMEEMEKMAKKTTRIKKLMEMGFSTKGLFREFNFTAWINWEIRKKKQMKIQNMESKPMAEHQHWKRKTLNTRLKTERISFRVKPTESFKNPF